MVADAGLQLKKAWKLVKTAGGHFYAPVQLLITKEDEQRLLEQEEKADRQRRAQLQEPRCRSNVDVVDGPGGGGDRAEEREDPGEGKKRAEEGDDGDGGEDVRLIIPDEPSRKEKCPDEEGELERGCCGDSGCHYFWKAFLIVAALLCFAFVTVLVAYVLEVAVMARLNPSVWRSDGSTVQWQRTNGTRREVRLGFAWHGADVSCQCACVENKKCEYTEPLTTVCADRCLGWCERQCVG